MPSQRKFYRTVFRFEVLSEDPIDPDMGLAALGCETDEGEMVGRFLDPEVAETMDGPAMARALTEAGSEPGFFQLTDDGNDTEADR